MNTSTGQQISGSSVLPVAKTEKGSNEPAPGFLSAYEAAYKLKEENAGQRQGQKAGSTLSDEEADADSSEGKRDWPEIFKLLERLLSVDFLQLSRADDDLRLSMIIKESRQVRGVSRTVPVSATHGENDVFIDQMVEQYFSTSNLMEATAGQRYRGLL